MTESPEIQPQTLRQQSAWLLIAKIIGFALSFFLPLLIVRYLSKESVGIYRESFLIITNAVIVLPLGFSMSAYYFLARETERRSSSILNILLFNFTAGAAAFLVLYLNPEFLGAIFKSDELTRLAPLIGAVIWVWICSTFLETVPIANQEARAAAVFIVISSVSKTILMGAAVLIFGSVEAFLYAALIQGLIQSALLLKYLWSRFPGFWKRFEFTFFRQQASYAIPFGLTGILWLAQVDVHNYFVAHKFTSSEFAIYAYGCFQVPLIAMLAESVTSVLIPRMNALQLVGDREEMIRLTARAMQKLAFFYFPIYVFLVITSTTFVTTLFTEEYAASVPIFVINLTLLPFSILITDPIVRSFRELGRVLLGIRIAVLGGMMTVFYFAMEQLSLTGFITVAIAAILVEKVVAETMIIKKLGVGLRHMSLLDSVAKTGIVSLFAGLATYLTYSGLHGYLTQVGSSVVVQIIPAAEPGFYNFAAGAFVLAVCGAVYLPIYLVGANLFGLVEEEEKRAVLQTLRRLFFRRSPQMAAGT
jgi:O-antigen/teichoic acid export membrane protein